MPDRTLPIAAEPSLLISVRLSELPKGKLRFWVRGKELNVPHIPKYGICINDLEESPAVQTHSKVDPLNFYIPRASLEDVAEDLGMRLLGKFADVFFDPDPFVTQLINILLPHLFREDKPDLLTADYLGLLFNAHLYSTTANTRCCVAAIKVACPPFSAAGQPSTCERTSPAE